MQVQLDIPEPLYAEIALVAAESGRSVEATMVERLAADFAGGVPEAFWTSERMAELQRAEAEARQGSSLTPDRVASHFAAKREAWRIGSPGWPSATR